MLVVVSGSFYSRLLVVIWLFYMVVCSCYYLLVDSYFKQYRRRDFWRVGGCCAVVVSGWSLVGLVGWFGCMQFAVSRVRVWWSLGLVSVGSFSCDLVTFRGWGWVVGRVGWFRAIVGRLCAICGTFAGWGGLVVVRGGRGRHASRVVVCGVGVRSSVIVTAARVVGRRGWVGTFPNEKRGRGCRAGLIVWCKHSISEKKKNEKNAEIRKSEKKKKPKN